jgi:hypothetical protein
MFNRQVSLMSRVGAFMALAALTVRGGYLPPKQKAPGSAPSAAPYRASYFARPRVADDFQSLVNAMTGYERNQWARKGYPGLRSGGVAAFKAAMPGLHATCERRRSGKILVIGGAA